MTRSTRWSRPVHYFILLVAHVELFVRPTGAGNNDWWLSFHPFADVVREIILRFHQFPWWNPWANGGVPLFADPEMAVVSLDTLLVLAFGAVVGPKLAVLLYTISGYEGTRALAPRLVVGGGGRPGDRTLAVWASVVPALVPALAGHLATGHYSFVSFHALPWLIVLGLTWRRSVWRSLALGLLVGYLLLTYIHYTTIMALTIAAVVVAVQFVLGGGRGRTWAQAALIGLAALGVCFTRLAVSAHWALRFPRPDAFYPFVVPVRLAVVSLFAPFRSGSHEQMPLASSELGWHEIGCYVGAFAFVLALIGLRRNGRWRVRWWHVIVPVLFLLAWNNEALWSPGHWARRVAPWSFLLIITRWRVFACYFLLIGAVSGLVALRRAGLRHVAWLALAVLVVDLGGHVMLAWHGEMRLPPPPWSRAPGPPVSVRTPRDEGYWPALRRNEVFLNAESTILRYHPATKRLAVGEAAYRGEVWGRRPARMAEWSPNRIVIEGAPGDAVFVNVNPGNYWRVGGEDYFANLPAVAPDARFQVKVPPSGRVTLRIRPPYLAAFGAVQAVCALLAAGLVVGLVRSRRRQGEPSSAPRTGLPGASAGTN